MKEIFDKQRELNIFTLRNIGVDYHQVLNDPEQQAHWLENYRKALSAELAEWIHEVREFGPETQNGVVEIVDMLHFLVSISQVAGYEPPQFAIAAQNGATLEKCSVEMFLALDDMQNSVKWKWWAKGGGFKPDAAKTAAASLWTAFAGLCGFFRLDFDTLKRVYIEKNRINFERQRNNYNEDTKTEADNRAIKI